MRKRKTKTICISIGLIVAGLLAGGTVFLLGKKELDFYRDKGMGEIRAVALSIDGTDNADIENGCYWIYDKDIIKELEAQLDKIELRVDYSGKEPEGDTGCWIRLLGDDEKIFSIMLTKEQSHYFGDVSMTYNSVVKEGIKNTMGMVKLSEEDGERIYELVKDIMETQIHKITPEEVKQLSEEEVYDWRMCQQYIHEDELHDTSKRRNGLESVGIARFDIEGTSGYLKIWYCSMIESKNGEHTVYEDVIDAVVYNENGDTMNLYDENISAFLEEMR